jgi:dTDP-4-dehydrorhamnose reductase
MRGFIHNYKETIVKILVTGAKGMLGSDLCPIWSEQHQVLATDIEEMDVRRPEVVFKTFESFKPDLVLHLAALTDVDGCEKQPDAAYHTNAIGTQVVALACQKFEAELVYISTLSVYDGTASEPYTEFDTPNPRSHYSRSKYHGEVTVQSLLRRYYIVRAGWMFGGGLEDKKFVAKIMELARSRSTLQIVDDKFGSPTHTCDLARGILRLVQTGWYGTYHMVNTGGAPSRYEIARHILQYAGITTCQLQPVSSAYFPLPAPRPRMEAGRNLHLELMGLELMQPWSSALQDYIQNRLLKA